MYCPKCGNHPSSDRVRYCPSCGFRLDAVADLLARDPATIHPSFTPQIPKPSPRQRGIRVGAKMCFFSVAMLLPVLMFAIGVVDHPFPLILPGTLFLTGIFWMIYFRLFGDDYLPAEKHTYVKPVAPQNIYMPSPQSPPAYRSPISAPQQESVVEHTTRTLEHQ
jgi:hypothetical protein